MIKTFLVLCNIFFCLVCGSKLDEYIFALVKFFIKKIDTNCIIFVLVLNNTNTKKNQSKSNPPACFLYIIIMYKRKNCDFFVISVM